VVHHAFRPAQHRPFAGLGASIFSANYAPFYYAGMRIASGLLSIVCSLAASGKVALGSIMFSARIEWRVVAGAGLGVALMFYPELGGMRLVLAVLGLAAVLGGNLLVLRAPQS
jgi:hypothetical protein